MSSGDRVNERIVRLSLSMRTLVNAHSSGWCSREDLRDGLDVCRVDRKGLRELGSELVAAGLGIVGSTSQRIEQYGSLKVLGVWRCILDPDEVVRRHHLAHGLVAETLTVAILDLVCLIHCGLESGKEVASIDDHADSANLTETEGGLDKDERKNVNKVIDSADHDAGTDSIGLDSLRREDEVSVLLEVGVDVAGDRSQHSDTGVTKVQLTPRCGCQG